MIEFGKKYRGNMLEENCQREIKEYFTGKTVVAQYGSYRAYRIGEVLTDKNVKNTNINQISNFSFDIKRIGKIINLTKINKE